VRAYNRGVMGEKIPVRGGEHEVARVNDFRGDSDILRHKHAAMEKTSRTA